MTTKHKNRSGLSRRDTLKAVGAAAALPLFNINHAWSQDVTYDGEIFDAGGAVLRIGEWPGFWQEQITDVLLADFEKDFNCKIEYNGAWPWFPKFVAGGPQNPPYDANNWNLAEMMKTARAGDYFLPLEEVKANVPNTADLWPFAFDSDVGVTWAYGRMCFFYNPEVVDPAPVGFESFWEDRFGNGKRGTYVAVNSLQMLFFMTASHVFGGDFKNMEAGFDAMRRAMPMKISDFTGNMQTLLTRGEVDIAVMIEGEVYTLQDQGVSVEVLHWDEKKALLTQTETISRYAEPMQKKLAFALLNRRLDPVFMTKFNSVFRYRPTNRLAEIPDNMKDKGVTNTADATKDFWIPDWNWYLENERDISETTNEIFGG